MPEEKERLVDEIITTLTKTPYSKEFGDATGFSKKAKTYNKGIKDKLNELYHLCQNREERIDYEVILRNNARVTVEGLVKTDRLTHIIDSVHMLCNGTSTMNDMLSGIEDEDFRKFIKCTLGCIENAASNLLQLENNAAGIIFEERSKEERKKEQGDEYIEDFSQIKSQIDELIKKTATSRAEIAGLQNKTETLQNQIKEVTKSLNAVADTARTDADTARTDADTARTDADTARTDANTARLDAKKAREEADAAKQTVDSMIPNFLTIIGIFVAIIIAVVACYLTFVFADEKVRGMWTHSVPIQLMQTAFLGHLLLSVILLFMFLVSRMTGRPIASHCPKRTKRDDVSSDDDKIDRESGQECVSCLYRTECHLGHKLRFHYAYFLALNGVFLFGYCVLAVWWLIDTHWKREVRGWINVHPQYCVAGIIIMLIVVALVSRRLLRWKPKEKDEQEGQTA